MSAATPEAATPEKSQPQPQPKLLYCFNGVPKKSHYKLIYFSSEFVAPKDLNKNTVLWVLSGITGYSPLDLYNDYKWVYFVHRPGDKEPGTDTDTPPSLEQTPGDPGDDVGRPDERPDDREIQEEASERPVGGSDAPEL